MGSDLYLNTFPIGADNRRMKALIHVGFGDPDVILEFFGNGFPEGMNQSQCFITMGNRIQNNPESDNVINFFKCKVLADHFLVNAVIIFVTAQNFAIQMGLGHFLLEKCFYLLNILFLLPFFHVDKGFYF